VYNPQNENYASPAPQKWVVI